MVKLDKPPSFYSSFYIIKISTSPPPAPAYFNHSAYFILPNVPTPPPPPTPLIRTSPDAQIPALHPRKMSQNQ